MLSIVALALAACGGDNSQQESTQISDPSAAPGEAVVVEEVDFGQLLAAADVAVGTDVANNECAACHSFDQGGGVKVGPSLWGVVGRDIAGIEGFNYSPPMSRVDGTWGVWRT